MISFKVPGAIFDVDDTLLDNKPGAAGAGLHERSRLAAVHAVGAKRGIPELVELTAQQNYDAFQNSLVHSLEAAVWGIMQMTGLADSGVINSDNKIFKEIVALKNDLHEDILRKYGQPEPWALEFVEALWNSGLQGKFAIASTAVRRDVDIFFEMTGLTKYFPSERIFTKESVTHFKPHPESFNKAFASLGLKEEERARVCAFEDDPRGIMSAKAAGLYTCAITTRYSREYLAALEVPPDLIADSYQEFAGYFGLVIAPTKG